VNVGRDRRGIVERPRANEPPFRAFVIVVDGQLAGRSVEGTMCAALVAGYIDRLQVALDQVHALGLDQEVDDEGA